MCQARGATATLPQLPSSAASRAGNARPLPKPRLGSGTGETTPPHPLPHAPACRGDRSGWPHEDCGLGRRVNLGGGSGHPAGAAPRTPTSRPRAFPRARGGGEGGAESPRLEVPPGRRAGCGGRWRQRLRARVMQMQTRRGGRGAARLGGRARVCVKGWSAGCAAARTGKAPQGRVRRRPGGSAVRRSGGEALQRPALPGGDRGWGAFAGAATGVP